MNTAAVTNSAGWNNNSISHSTQIRFYRILTIFIGEVRQINIYKIQFDMMIFEYIYYVCAIFPHMLPLGDQLCYSQPRVCQRYCCCRSFGLSSFLFAKCSPLWVDLVFYIYIFYFTCLERGGSVRLICRLIHVVIFFVFTLNLFIFTVNRHSVVSLWWW